MSGHTHESDRSAAFTGLIVGAIALGILLYGIVRWTNARYAKDEVAKPTASALR
ncbi:MAG: hypothetical protein HYR75_05805 [Gemmatimonadetes bacterium]|nr:hypothetical protein [Gemmatimonadota bacterium]MBI3569182.1 hypothetical protein [Gemmatimonadota bacterium]